MSLYNVDRFLQFEKVRELSIVSYVVDCEGKTPVLPLLV